MPYSSAWCFGLAVGYTAAYTLLLLPGCFMAAVALRNMQVVCFRSLGRPYLACLLATALLAHLLNLAAVWHLALVADERRVIAVNGTLTGLRVAIAGLMYSAVCSRQYMLARIFGTLKGGGLLGRYQAFWPPVLVAMAAWGLILVLFYVVLFLSLDVTAFAVPLFLYYVAYSAFIITLGVKNRDINKLFSDYHRNLVSAGCFIVVIILSVWTTVQYQLVSLQTYIFETAVSYVVGTLSCIALLPAVVPAYLMWKTNPDLVRSWEDFNKKHRRLYEPSSTSWKSDVGLECTNEALSTVLSIPEAAQVVDVDQANK